MEAVIKMSKREQIIYLYEAGMDVRDICATVDADFGSVTYAIYKHRKAQREQGHVVGTVVKKSASKTVGDKEKSAKNNEKAEVSRKVETKKSISEKTGKEDKKAEQKFTELADKVNEKPIVAKEDMKSDDKSVALVENVKPTKDTKTDTITKVVAEEPLIDNESKKQSIGYKSVGTMAESTKQIIQMLADGKSTADVAKALNFKEKTVRRYLYAYKDKILEINPNFVLPLQNSNGQVLSYRNGDMAESTEKIIQMFADGKTPAEIAKEIDFKEDTVRRYMYKYMENILQINPEFNVPLQKRGRPLGTLWANVEDVLKDVADGMSLEDVAKKYEVQSIRSLKSFLFKNVKRLYELNPNYNISELNEIYNTPITEHTRELLTCIANGEKFEDIGAKYGIKPVSLYKTRKDHLIEILGINPNYISDEEKKILTYAAAGAKSYAISKRMKMTEYDVLQVMTRYQHILPMMKSRGMLYDITELAPINVAVNSDLERVETTCNDAVTTDEAVVPQISAETAEIVREFSKKFKSQRRGEYTSVPLDVDAIIKELAAGHSAETVAEKVGVSTPIVLSIRKARIKDILQVNPNLLSEQDLQILESLNNDENRLEISLRYGVSKNEVYCLQRKYLPVFPQIKEFYVSQTDNVSEGSAMQDVKKNGSEMAENVNINANSDIAPIDLAELIERDAVKYLQEQYTKQEPHEKKDTRGGKVGRVSKKTVGILCDLVNGVSVQEIAEKNQLTAKGVYFHKERFADIIKKYSENTEQVVSDEQKKQGMLKDIANGMYFKTAASYYNMDEADVITYCCDNYAEILEYNSKFNLKWLLKRQTNKYVEKIDAILQLLAQGKSSTEVSKEIEVACNYVRCVRRAYIKDILQINPNLITAKELKILEWLHTGVNRNVVAKHYGMTCKDVYILEQRYLAVYPQIKAFKEKHIDAGIQGDSMVMKGDSMVMKGEKKCMAEQEAKSTKTVVSDSENKSNSVQQDAVNKTETDTKQNGHDQQAIWTAPIANAAISAVENEISQCKQKISIHKEQLQNLETNLAALENAKSLLEKEIGGVN